jgi:hypothetical protein
MQAGKGLPPGAQRPGDGQRGRVFPVIQDEDVGVAAGEDAAAF